MENTDDYAMPEAFYQPNYRLLRRVLNIAVGLMLVTAASLLLLTAYGYGTAEITGVPQNAAVRINGHAVSGTALKLRPGNYQVAISTPFITPYIGTLHIAPFRTTNFNPNITLRNPDAIASSVIGAVPGTTAAPHFAQFKWFQQNTWVAGALKPTDPLKPTELVYVFHFDSAVKRWATAYSTAGNDPKDLTSLPGDVAAYIQPLVQAGGQ